MRRRIVVVGGGCGAMAAVFALTEEPDWQDRYDITVYQLGWRLGGKGASGRGGPFHRVEEHGIHMWNGFYDNAFSVMRRVYEELGRPPDAPLATFDRAFVGRDRVVYHEDVNGRAARWPLWFPPNGRRPGLDPGPATLWDYAVEAVDRLLHLVPDGDEPGADLVDRTLGCVVRALQAGRRVLAGPHRIGPAPLPPVDTAGLREARLRAADRDGDGDVDAWEALTHHVAGFLDTLTDAADALWRHGDRHAPHFDPLRRLLYLAEVTVAVLRGVLHDRVLERGYAAIDHVDFQQWLRDHGASAEAAGCAPIRALYDAMFAYEDGDPERPAIAAGSVLQGALGLFLGYKGHLYYQMQGGMGDVVFAPLYEVLRRRGVRFRFFHIARELTTGDGVHVDRVTFGVQARVRGGDYAPLVDVEGLPSWPSAPLWDQLDDADALRGRDFELPGTPDVDTCVLERGRDFDAVLLAIPPAAQAVPCADLIARDPVWADMVGHLGAVATVGAQLWFRPSWSDLGWSDPPTIGAGWPAPLPIWADATDLPGEPWPPGGPRAVAYLTGALPFATGALPISDPRAKAAADRSARRATTAWLDTHAGTVWPRGAPDGALDPDLLFDPEGGNGPARLAWQYVRANVAPSELYVQSLPGTGRFRMGPDASIFRDLFFAGDWTDMGYNMGFVEAAVISGLQAADAIRETTRVAIPEQSPPRREPTPG